MRFMINAFWKGRLVVMLTVRIGTDLRLNTVFRRFHLHDNIEHLPLVFRQRLHARQVAMAFFTVLYFMDNYMVGMIAHLQPMRFMARLSATFLSTLAPKAFGIWFLVAIAGGWLAAVVTVLAELPL